MAEDAGAAVAPHAQVPQPQVEQEDRQVRAEALAEERIQTTVKDMLSEAGKLARVFKNCWLANWVSTTATS